MKGSTMLGVIVGISFFDTDFPEEGSRKMVETDWGTVPVYEGDQLCCIQRHESSGGAYMAPHEVPHRAQLAALKEKDVDHICSVQSTLSLTQKKPKGSLVIPEDFFCPWTRNSFFTDRRSQHVPEIDGYVRTTIREGLIQNNIRFQEGGIFVEGPDSRLATKAEAQLYGEYGGIFGMTGATEVILACEYDFSVALLCSVDQYMNGIENTDLTWESYQKGIRKNRPKFRRAVNAVIQQYRNE